MNILSAGFSVIHRHAKTIVNPFYRKAFDTNQINTVVVRNTFGSTKLAPPIIIIIKELFLLCKI